MKIILISGTPGTGKTSTSHIIAETMKSEVVSLNELAISKKFTSGYDDKRDTHIVDFDKLLPHLMDLIEDHKKHNTKYLIIESHFSDIVPDDLIDYVIIFRCHPDTLQKRLDKRDYSRAKIKENIKSEILGNSVNFMLEKELKTPILEIDTTSLDIDSVAKIVINIIANDGNIDDFKLGKVDWLEELAQNDRYKEFFD